MTKRPSVALAACGMFRYENLARPLFERGVLDRFTYAHKVTTTGKRLGIPSEKAVNNFVRAYLVHLYGRTPGLRSIDSLLFRIDDIWDRQAARQWRPADILQCVIHAQGTRLLHRARDSGAWVLGHPVNGHPKMVMRLLNEEHDRLNLPPVPAAAERIERYADQIDLTDWLIVDSRHVHNTYVAEGYDPTRITIIRPGENASRFAPPKTPRDSSDTFRVISVGQISPRKGHIDLLTAWKKAAFDDAELVLIGGMSGGMADVIAPFRDQFRYPGRVPNAELVDWFHNSSVFVLPSIEDGFGQVVSEALSSGIPAIVSENAGAADLIRDGENGYVVPARDPDTLCDRLTRLYEDRGLLAQLTDNARRPRDRSTWDDYADKLLTVYENRHS